MIKRLNELELKGKRVFVRVDFNVPIHHGKISETHRIESVLPTLRFVIGKAEKVVIASHLGRPGGKRDPASSLAPVRDFLEQALASPVTLAPDCVGPEVDALVRDPRRKIILLENLRFHKEEEKNDPGFARALAALADIYVNDAFGAAHRAHASTAGMAAYFQAKGAGLLLQKEMDYLGKILADPERPFVTVLGGAKVSDKIAVIRNLLPKLDSLLIGGAMAYTFLKGQGIPVGRSLVEEGRIELARELLDRAGAAGVALLLPTDHIAAAEDRKNPMETGIAIPEGLAGLDIGPKTRSRFHQEIRKAKLALWNGPVGLFEDERFSAGTNAVARALAESPAVSIVAGGDTVAAVMQAGLQDRFTHLSTGGGATLEFLEGRTLPGIAALEVDA